MFMKKFLTIMLGVIMLVQIGCSFNPEDDAPNALSTSLFDDIFTFDISAHSPQITPDTNQEAIENTPSHTVPSNAIYGVPFSKDDNFSLFSLDFPVTVPSNIDNLDAYDVEPFNLSFLLPKGWYCLTTPVAPELYLGARYGNLTGIGAAYSVIWLYNELDVCVGAVGYNTYNSDETGNDYEMIYQDINQDKDYRFATSEYYYVVSDNNSVSGYNNDTFTAVTQVYYSTEILHYYGHWEAFSLMNMGILSHNNKLDVYVAFEFFSISLNSIELIDIAKSISISTMS